MRPALAVIIGLYLSSVTDIMNRLNEKRDLSSLIASIKQDLDVYNRSATGASAGENILVKELEALVSRPETVDVNRFRQSVLSHKTTNPSLMSAVAKSYPLIDMLHESIYTPAGFTKLLTDPTRHICAETYGFFAWMFNMNLYFMRMDERGMYVPVLAAIREVPGEPTKNALLINVDRGHHELMGVKREGGLVQPIFLPNDPIIMAVEKAMPQSQVHRSPMFAVGPEIQGACSPRPFQPLPSLAPVMASVKTGNLSIDQYNKIKPILDKFNTEIAKSLPEPGKENYKAQLLTAGQSIAQLIGKTPVAESDLVPSAPWMVSRTSTGVPTPEQPGNQLTRVVQAYQTQLP
jgi:hypothetical protein